MKGNVVVVIFLALGSIYLVNVSMIVASLTNTMPKPRELEQLSPVRSASRNRPLPTDAIISDQLPVYTNEMAAQAIRPAPWICGNRNDSAIDLLTQQKPMFAFIHIYKTAGSTMRSFFNTYAYICRKGWICLQRCTDVTPSSIKSMKNWKKCEVEHAVDRNLNIEKYGVKRKLYRHVNNTVLRNSFDLFGGHTRLGVGDYIFNKSDNNINPVRHIVFLRDPLDRYISGILYQNQKKKKGWTSADFARLVKERVLSGEASGDYWDRSLSYLLTPGQAEYFNNIKSTFTKTNTTEQLVRVKAITAINNLMNYNVIIGMTERMSESIEILKHILLTNATQKDEELLNTHGTNKTLNVSRKGHVSTSSVLDELKKDSQFMSTFKEHVKYEKMITDYAMNMHLMQHEQIQSGIN